LIYNLDPRAKLILTAASLIVIFLLPGVGGQLLCLGIISAAIPLNHLAFSKIIRSVRYLLILLPITLLVHFLITAEGWQVIIGSRELNLVMFKQPLLFTLRLGNLIFLMAFGLQWIRNIEFLDAVYHLLKPLQRWCGFVDNLFQMIFIAVKFFPILSDEYRQMRENWRIYLNDSGISLIDRVRQIQDTLVPLMVLSFQRAETLAGAMTIRGYGSQSRRSYYQTLRMTQRDWLAVLIAVFAAIIVICYNKSIV
jgi:energy-coupling factor transport system permease protein